MGDADEILRFLRGSREGLHTRDLPTVIADLPAAQFKGYWNELALDEKPDTNDPCKLRFGAWPSTETGYLGAITADVLSGGSDDPRRSEQIILALKMDSDPATRDHPTPMLEVFCQVRDGTGSDADMRRVLSLSAHEIVFHVPVRYASGEPPPALPPVIPPIEPPAAGFVYRKVDPVSGLTRSFRQGVWDDVRAVFPFPVDDDVVAAYERNPTEAAWIAVVDRMFVRRDD